MNHWNDTAKNFGMKGDVQITKTMVDSGEGGGIINITVDGQRIEQVKFQILRLSYFKRMGEAMSMYCIILYVALVTHPSIIVKENESEVR
jgi:hypothetical protein